MIALSLYMSSDAQWGYQAPDDSSNSVCSVSQTAVSCCWLLGFFNSSAGSLSSCQGTGVALSGMRMYVCMCVCVYRS